MRTTSNLVMLLFMVGRAYAGGDYEGARLEAGSNARDLAVSSQVEQLLAHKEAEVAQKRQEGIRLIEIYLREHPHTPETAEVLFQLAELKWEEAKATFLSQMAVYNAAVEKCASSKEPPPKNEKKRRGAVRLAEPERCKLPPQPELELSSSQKLYARLINDHPDFRKIDAVLYLYGFSLRASGHLAEALVQFKRILKDHPHSRFRPDAWMAVAEARFYEDGDFRGALDGYDQVLKYPESPLYDLALFKTAWCYWKLGDSDRAARRFKEVLDLGSGKAGPKAHQITKEGKKRLEELKGEALEYLVQVFTEDEKKGPKDAFDFLTSIGGAIYSRKVIGKLAETFFAQARYDRAIESERFLITLDPLDPECPERQKRIVEAYREMDENKEAVREMRKLAETYGPESDWAKAVKDKAAVKKAHELAAQLLREVAKQLHAEAQRIEQQQKYVDPNRYARAADAYAYYLSKFGGDPDAVEAHYLLGDIYFFKLKKYEEAGDEYLRVGQSKPVGKFHKEALLQSVSAYEKVRQQKGGTALLPSDKKMGEAIEIYTSLYPNDPEIASILVKTGELFFARGEYDEAVKRFGLIVEKYPKHPAAAHAGDKILESLNKAKDYANVEAWARRLLKVPAFQSRADQERLSKLVIDAGMKSGEQLAEKDPLAAAAMYQRVATEFPGSSRAAQAWTNAALTFVRGQKPEEAVRAYGILVERYPLSSEAANAAWSAGKLYEQAALWDQAARYYQLLADKFPKDTHAADALFNAGLLREHLGDLRGATSAYSEYTRRYKSREDVHEVAFRLGVVYADAGQKDQAARVFLDLAQKSPSGKPAILAYQRAGQALMELGPQNDRRSEETLEKAVALFKRANDKSAASAAAHARYLQGEIAFRQFERLQLANEPKRLKRTLDEKSTLLEKAKSIYVDVVSFRDPEWATAALYRIGEAYERFAKALRGTPTPPGLNAEEQQVYRDEPEKAVVVVEEKAIDAYKGGYQRALQLGVYNDFTHKLRQALGRLDAQEFPPEAEARARPAAAAPAVELPFVGSVER
jgi:cellulose synthase operon protein C